MGARAKAQPKKSPGAKRKKEFPSKEQGARLNLLLMERQLTQTDLGAMAKVDQEWISRWIAGKRDMSALALLRVAQALGVSLHWMLTGNDTEPTPRRGFVRVDPAACGDPDVDALTRELSGDPPESADDCPDANGARAVRPVDR